MTNLYETLRERARKFAKDQFIAVPIEPSLGMMIAAAETTDVFADGDQLWHYFTSYEQEHDVDSIFVDPGLIARFGVQKAFAIACLADMWGACVDGTQSWLTTRSRGAIVSEHRKEDLLYYLPDRCPKGGWPLTKDQVSDEHKAFGRCTTELFTSNYMFWWNYDADVSAIAPRRLTYSAGWNAQRIMLSVSAFLEVDDAIDLAKTPFIPGWTKDAYYDDEESSLLVLAAMWRGAVAWLLSDEHPDGVAFPYHPDCQAVILSNMAYRHREFYDGIEKFFEGFPYHRFAIFTDKAMLAFAAENGEASYWYEEAEGNAHIRKEGLRLRVGADDAELRKLLLRVFRNKVNKVEARPLPNTATG